MSVRPVTFVVTNICVTSITISMPLKCNCKVRADNELIVYNINIRIELALDYEKHKTIFMTPRSPSVFTDIELCYFFYHPMQLKI